MERQIFIKSRNNTQCAVVEDGKLCEFCQDSGDCHKANSIYAGKVARIVPGMNAAFIDIGEEKCGFLPLEEKTKFGDFPRLSCGDKVLVQIQREAQGTKGALLSRDVTLCGSCVMVMPLNSYVGVSAKIEDTSQRQQLKHLGERLKERFGCGIIMRTSSAEAAEDEISNEAGDLCRQWNDMQHAFPVSHAPSCIRTSQTAYEKLISDYTPEAINAVITDDEEIFSCLSESHADLPVKLVSRIAQWDSICTEFNQAMSRSHKLPCGGNLIVDVCEAMTVIDVNTSSNTGERLQEDTIFNTNMQACSEIARLMRLRNISGIIIVDMIDMAEKKHQEQLLDEMRSKLKQDRIKTVVHGMTSLGLIEITRRRSTKAVEQAKEK